MLRLYFFIAAQIAEVTPTHLNSIGWATCAAVKKYSHNFMKSTDNSDHASFERIGLVGFECLSHCKCTTEYFFLKENFSLLKNLLRVFYGNLQCNRYTWYGVIFWLVEFLMRR